MLFSRSSRTLVAALVGSLALAACAPVGLSAQPGATSSSATVASPATGSPSASAEGSATAEASAGVSATATSSPSQEPSPSADPTSEAPATPDPSPSETAGVAPADLSLLKPGTNHNWAADEAGYVYSAKTVNAWLTGEKKRPEKKTVFLTFDDGPNSSTTPVILKALRDAKVHATFFVVGSQVGAAPAMLTREIAEGHSVSLHSWSHDYSILYPGRKGDTKAIMHEYDKTLAKVRSVLGDDYQSESWRYPGGHMSWTHLDGADKALAKHGVSWIDWNSDTRDSAPTSERPKTIAATVKNATIQIKEGYHVIVVLGHDTRDKKLTSESVGAMIKAFKKAGYAFATIS